MTTGRPLQSSGRPGRAPRRAMPGHMRRPYLVRSFAELVPDLAGAAQAVLPPGREVRHIFVLPPQEFPSSAKYRFGPAHALIFTDAGVIHAQTAALGQPAQARLLPNADVLYLQVDQLLLYGRLEIGYAIGGQAQEEAVEFNTVGWDLLHPALQEWLQDVNAAYPPLPAEVEAPAGSGGFATEIERMPKKFANGVELYALAPGERLLALTFQPDVRERRLGIFWRQVRPPAVLLLTDRHVSLIEEPRALTKSKSYGWTFSFMPRHCVIGARSEPSPLGRLVSIELLTAGARTTRELELTSEVAAAWEAQWRTYGGHWNAEDENSEG